MPPPRNHQFRNPASTKNSRCSILRQASAHGILTVPIQFYRIPVRVSYGTVLPAFVFQDRAHRTPPMCFGERNDRLNI